MAPGDVVEAEPFVVAVDAGGTHTRVACWALDGRRLASARGAAGAWHHHDDAVENLRSTVRAALRDGGLAPDDAVGLVAGVSGISSRGGRGAGDRSLGWARSAYAVPELRCPVVFVNDAVTAHRGALLGRPGVMVVAGTGSMVLAITAEAAEAENGELGHYAGGARHLAADAVQQVLAGRVVPDDAGFVEALLAAWGVADVAQLRSAVRDLHRAGDHHAADRRFGGIAPLVSAAADHSPLADAALRRLTARTADGALLLVPLVGTAPVAVTTTGSLATHPSFSTRLRQALATSAAQTELVEPAADALVGAALMAMDLAEQAPGEGVVRRMRSAAPV